MRCKATLALMLVPLLAACAAQSVTHAPPAGPAKPPPSVTPRVPPTEPPRQHFGFRQPRIMHLPGLEAVIGNDTGALTRLFGQPRLDVREGDARKLQFGGKPCVLDVYLYPDAPGATPRASYVDARRASDGRDVDRASCVAALKK
jgi:hypothetical protein